MYTILVADDQELICDGISRLIAELFPQLDLIGSCNCGRDILEILQTDIPDILVIDIRMPDINGLDVCKQIREKSKRTKIVLISGYKEFEYAKTALELNAMAYLVKPYAPRELVKVLNDAIAALQEEDALHAPGPLLIEPSDGFIHDTVQAIRAYIEQNYSDPTLSLSVIARKFSLSYTYASSIFRAGSDISINDFLNNIRITHAKAIIRTNPNATLESIAQSVGYSSATYFGKIFKDRCGMTPSQYKRKMNML